MNINESLMIPWVFPPSAPDSLISFILFPHSKIAHAHKSGIGKGEKGCGCEGKTVHNSDLT